jgi:O-antigen/teichoic acid export membrane protein
MTGRLIGLIGARLLSPLVSFLIILLVAREWGQTDLGQYMTVLAWLAIFQVVSVFGLGEYTSKEVGKNPSNGAQYLAHGLFIGILFSLICISLMAGGVILFKYSDNVKNAVMIAGLALPSTMGIMVCQAIFTAFQKIKYIAYVSIPENAVLLILGAIVIVKGYGLIPLIWCIVLVRLLALVFSLFLAHTYVTSLRFRIDRRFVLKLVAPVVIFGLTGAFNQVFLRSDVIMLSKMKDMVTVGLYGSTSKLMEICLMLPTAFYVLTLPVAARFFVSSRESEQPIIEKHTRELFILVFFLFGFATFFAEPILGLLYGQSFTQAAWTLRILMLVFLIHSSEMVLGMCCQAAGHHNAALYVVIFRATTNVMLNFILIPIWGMNGAALATLISISASFVIIHNFVRKNLYGFKWIRMNVKPAAVCLITVLLLFPLSGHLNLLFMGIMFFLLYSFMLLALNGFSIGRVWGLDSRSNH